MIIKAYQTNFRLLKAFFYIQNTTRNMKKQISLFSANPGFLEQATLLEKHKFSLQLMKLTKLSPEFYFKKGFHLRPHSNIFVINHRSMLDIPLFQMIQTNQAINLTWVAKKELFSAPFVGKFFKFSGCIPVDRESSTGALGLFKLVKEVISKKNNQNIVIFPEGTRNKTTDLLLPFKSGTGKIADLFKLNIIPVFIYENTAELMNNQDENKKVHIFLGAPISSHNLEQEYTEFCNFVISNFNDKIKHFDKGEDRELKITTIKKETLK